MVANARTASAALTISATRLLMLQSSGSITLMQANRLKAKKTAVKPRRTERCRSYTTSNVEISAEAARNATNSRLSDQPVALA